MCHPDDYILSTFGSGMNGHNLNRREV